MDRVGEIRPPARRAGHVREPSAARCDLLGRILEAGEPGAPVPRGAGALCRDYWYPLYAFVASKGARPRDRQTSFRGCSPACWNATTSATWNRSGGGSVHT